MKNSYTLTFEQNLYPVIHLNGEVIKITSKIPKKIINDIAEKCGLYLYGEMSMETGKHIFKVGKVINDNGGVVNLFSSESKTAFYDFVYQYSYPKK